MQYKRKRRSAVSGKCFDKYLEEQNRKCFYLGKLKAFVSEVSLAVSE